jgi:hypothetical protein
MLFPFEIKWFVRKITKGVFPVPPVVMLPIDIIGVLKLILLNIFTE